MLDVYIEPEADNTADANPLEPTALKVAADRTPLQKIAANVVDAAQASKEAGDKKEGAEKARRKKKHRVSFGGEKIQHYKKSPRDAKPRASMSYFPRKMQSRSSLASVPAKPAFDMDKDFFDDDTDNNMTMDFTDMSIMDLDMVDTLSGMNTFAGAPFDEEDLVKQQGSPAKNTMHNFNIDPSLTQGLKALVGDLSSGLFDTAPAAEAATEAEKAAAPKEAASVEAAPVEAAPVEEAAAPADEPEEEEEDDSAMEMTMCAPREEAIAPAEVSAQEVTEQTAEKEAAEEFPVEVVAEQPAAEAAEEFPLTGAGQVEAEMEAMEDDFQFDDDFGDEDATEHMFAVTHGRASLGPLEFANHAAAAEAEPGETEEQEQEQTQEQEHAPRQSMNLTVGDLETGTLTYNNTGFSDGSSMSSASITDLYSTSNPRIMEQPLPLAKQPRESMVAEDRTEHIFGARGRRRSSMMRRKSSMGLGEEEDTAHVFGAGMNTQVLFEQVEDMRHQAEAVQFEDAEEEEDNSIFVKTNGTATNELARLMLESREQLTGKENVQPLEDDDTHMDDLEDEDRTEKFLLSHCPTFAGGDNTGTFSTFSLLNSASRHSTATLSELASKLQLTPLDVRPQAAAPRGNNAMSLEYFLCQAKVHFVGIATMRKISTCPVSIPYEDLLADKLPAGAEQSLVPHVHTKLVVEPQLEACKAVNAGYEEQILAKQQSIEQLASELSRNNPRSFVLAMQPESREIVVNCLKELKQKCRMDAKAQWYSQHIHGLAQKRDRLREVLQQVKDEVKAWEEAVEEALSSDMKSSCPPTPELHAKHTSDSAKKVEQLQASVREQEDTYDTLQGLQGWRLSAVKANEIKLLVADSHRLSFKEDGGRVAASLQALPGFTESPLRKAVLGALGLETLLAGVADMQQVPAAAQTVSLWLGRAEEVIEECEEAEQLHPNLSLSYGQEGGAALVRARFVPPSGPAAAALHAFSLTFSVAPAAYPFAADIPLAIDNEEGGSGVTMARNGIASAAVRELAAKFAPPRCSFGRIRHTFAALVDALYGQ